MVLATLTNYNQLVFFCISKIGNDQVTVALCCTWATTVGIGALRRSCFVFTLLHSSSLFFLFCFWFSFVTVSACFLSTFFRSTLFLSVRILFFLCFFPPIAFLILQASVFSLVFPFPPARQRSTTNTLAGTWHRCKLSHPADADIGFN